jgi:hypothetical protein
MKKALPILDLVTFVTLVVMEDEVAVFRGKIGQTAPQALDAGLRIDDGFHRHSLRLGNLVQRAGGFSAVAAHFPQEHSRDPNHIGGNVADLVTFSDLPGTAIDGLVGILVRRRTASPFEEPHQVAPNLEVPVGGGVAIGPDGGE